MPIPPSLMRKRITFLFLSFIDSEDNKLTDIFPLPGLNFNALDINLRKT